LHRRHSDVAHQNSRKSAPRARAGDATRPSAYKYDEAAAGEEEEEEEAGACCLRVEEREGARGESAARSWWRSARVGVVGIGRRREEVETPR
jgi:hypothetical protein